MSPKWKLLSDESWLATFEACRRISNATLTALERDDAELTTMIKVARTERKEPTWPTTTLN